jgi:hypothetical protein
MRCRHILLALALSIPTIAQPQAAPRVSGVERFDTAGLPASAASALEKEIFMLLRYHRRGDLRDATRIHLKLAEYYKDRGETTRADDCAKMANEAWEAAEKGLKVSAGTGGTPPFEPARTFRQNFAYSDEELGASHRWEFYEDGTYAHSLTTPAGQTAPPPKELGWYTVLGGEIRLWQTQPLLDKTVAFELSGDMGKGGLVMDGVKMRAVR